jgi:hypothetical protein
MLCGENFGERIDRYAATLSNRHSAGRIAVRWSHHPQRVPEVDRKGCSARTPIPDSLGRSAKRQAKLPFMFLRPLQLSLNNHFKGCVLGRLTESALGIENLRNGLPGENHPIVVRERDTA